jgi:hypothetical protein
VVRKLAERPRYAAISQPDAFGKSGKFTLKFAEVFEWRNLPDSGATALGLRPSLNELTQMMEFESCKRLIVH